MAICATVATEVPLTASQFLRSIIGSTVAAMQSLTVTLTRISDRRRRVTISFTKILLIMTIASVTGCGGDGRDGFKGARGTVNGTLTIAGEPVPEGCQILFRATDGPYTPGGVVDAEGRYFLTYKGSLKLPALSYRVQVSAPPMTENATSPVNPAELASQIGKKSSQMTPPTLPFPARYSTTVSSPLEFTVKEGANTADFDLQP